MPFWRCLLRGERFPGEIIGETGRYGFYTTRWVQALTPQREELRAIEALRRDPKLALPPGVAPPLEARVFLEEIDQVEKLPRFSGGGASWYKDEGLPNED